MFGCYNLSLESFANVSKTQELGDFKKGKELFGTHCESCHHIQKVLEGPALKGILERRKMPWIVNWVHNPAKVVAGGDPYARNIVEEFSSVGVMTGFPSLKKKEIKDKMAYVGAF